MNQILHIAKKEISDYTESYTELFVITLVVFASLLFLLSPDLESNQIPGTYGLYKVGVTADVAYEDVSSPAVSITIIDKNDIAELSSTASFDLLIFKNSGEYILKTTQSKRTTSAVEQLRRFFIAENMNRAYDAAIDKNIEDKLFPLRIRIIKQNISFEGLTDRQARFERLRQLSSYGDNLRRLNKTNGEVVEAGLVDDELYGFPDDLEDTFPFESLYVNIGFLATNMFICILASISIMREVVDKTMNNLFLTPMPYWKILMGKILPYTGIMMLFNIFFGFLVIGMEHALQTVLVFTFLSLIIIGFSLAVTVSSKNYRELTFNMSFFLLVFFLYIIFPNVFSGINPLAAISPLDLVIRIQNNAPTTFQDIFWSLLPYNMMGISFYIYTLLVFNPENVYSRKNMLDIVRTAYISLAIKVKTWWIYTIIAVGVLIPFIYLAQNMMAFLTFPMNAYIKGIWLFTIISLALIEELVKIAPYLLIRSRNPIKYGFLAGLSFFIFEKLFNIYLITKVYSILPAPWTAIVVKGLFATMIIHIITTTINAIVIHKTEKKWVIIFSIIFMVLLHTGYNIFAPDFLLGRNMT